MDSRASSCQQQLGDHRLITGSALGLAPYTLNAVQFTVELWQHPSMVALSTKEHHRLACLSMEIFFGQPVNHFLLHSG